MNPSRTPPEKGGTLQPLGVAGTTSMCCTSAIAFLAPVALHPCVQIRATRAECGRVEDLRLDPFLREEVAEKARRRELVARRVRRVHAQIIAQQRHPFAL